MFQLKNNIVLRVMLNITNLDKVLIMESYGITLPFISFFFYNKAFSHNIVYIVCKMMVELCVTV